MKIDHILIENYKSIKKIDFSPNKGINAFIGENSVGKSNIFNAIYASLGPVYPSFNNTKDEDHFNCDPSNEIKIRLSFDDGNYLELAETWSTRRGETKSGLNLNNNYVNDDTRQEYCCGYLDTERKITEYLPSNKWSLVGRILQEINKLFKKEVTAEGILKSEKLKQELGKIRDELLFSVKNEQGEPVMQKFVSILQKESASQLNKPESDFSVDMQLYDPWNFYRTLQLIVKEQDMGLEFPAANLGMGIQASISIAVLKAYSELNIRNRNPIFIDEPELFLHPQAQRNFYNILRKLADEGTQIFYNTHSPDFVSAGHFDELFIVRKTREEGTYLSHANPDNFVKDLKNRTGIDSDTEALLDVYQNACDNTGDSQRANEAFFAKKVILVEGQTESLVIPYFFKLINFNYNKEGISIVRCGCKNELDRFYRLYSALGIPCFVIFDGDHHLDTTTEKSKNIQENKSLFLLLDKDNSTDYPDSAIRDNYLGFNDTIEESFGFSIPSGKKGLESYWLVKQNIKDENNVPSWVTELKTKILALKPIEDSNEIFVLDTSEESADESQEEGEINIDDIPF